MTVGSKAMVPSKVTSRPIWNNCCAQRAEVGKSGSQLALRKLIRPAQMARFSEDRGGRERRFVQVDVPTVHKGGQFKMPPGNL